MYTNYFGLKEKPFSIAANPRFLYMGELHREAMAHLLYGITSEGCIILLTGDVGTGKTTLYRSMVEQLPEDTDVAIVLNPQLGLADILKTICDELSIPAGTDATSVKSSIDSINRYLLDAHSKGRNTAVIIDEAQNLDKNVLEHLRLLTNLETDTNKLLQIVLVGQPELKRMLDDPELSQINQRITARYHLGPLKQEDVFRYIEHRLSVAAKTGYPLFPFTRRALKTVAAKSGGVPRLINLLCDRSLLGAYVENKHEVDHHIVKKATKEIIGKRPITRRLVQRYLAYTVLPILVVILPLLFGLYHFDNDTPSPEGSKLFSIVHTIKDNSSTVDSGRKLAEQPNSPPQPVIN